MAEEEIMFKWDSGPVRYAITATEDGRSALYIETEDAVGRPYLMPVGDREMAYAAMMDELLLQTRGARKKTHGLDIE